MCIMLSGILAYVPGTLDSEMRESFQILVRKTRHTTVRNGKHWFSFSLFDFEWHESLLDRIQKQGCFGEGEGVDYDGGVGVAYDEWSYE